MTATDQIEQESERHRANVSVLIEELREHVTPGEIVNQVIGAEVGGDMVRLLGREVGRQVRKNPLPVAVIGIGVAWLLLADALRKQRKVPLHDGLDYERYGEISSRSRSGILGGAKRIVRGLSAAAARARVSASAQEVTEMTDNPSEKSGGSIYGTGPSASPTTDTMQNTTNAGRQMGDTATSDQTGTAGRSGLVQRASSLGQGAVDKATGLAQAALGKSGEAISGAAETVSQTASALMERTNEMARKTKSAVASRASNAGSSIGQLAREQPLLVAGIGFAVGVAVGALLPLTRTENELLGEQAEKLKDSASELASEGYEKAKAVAQRTYQAATDTLKDAAESQGLAGSGSSETSGQSATSGGSEASSLGTEGRTYGSDNGGDTSGIYRH
jgi:ElaB/YqjD/DUF883 family membrane-anchored ribosome-binding protein